MALSLQLCVCRSFSSMHLYALTGFDRFLRIKYLEEYTNVFTKKRFRVVLTSYLALVLFQTVLTVSLNSTNFIGYAFYYTFPINCFVLVFVTLFYTISILKLRRYKRSNESLSEATQMIMNITGVYLYLFIIYVGFFIILQVLIKKVELTEGQIIAFRNAQGVSSSVVGIINALAFLKINRPTSMTISQMNCSVLVKRNSVNIEEEQQNC